jgi:hypothetical protein
MFCRTLRLLLVGIGVAASSGDSSAQVTRSLAVNATVPDIGVVVSSSTPQWIDSGPGHATGSGTVNTKHNGPYLLQVRLTTVQPDTILARTPDGTYDILGTGGWTTVAAGPGGANLVNTINYRLSWATSSGRPTSEAPAIGLVYRVVTP